MEKKFAKIVVILAAVVGLMSVGPMAYAESDGDNPETGKGPQLGADQGIIGQLKLAPEQRESFLVERQAQQQDDKTMMQQLASKTDALNALVVEEGTTRADMNDFIEEMSALHARLLSIKMDHIFAMKQILTPEQFAKLQALDKQPMNGNPGGPGAVNQGPGMNQNPGGPGAVNQGPGMNQNPGDPGAMDQGSGMGQDPGGSEGMDQGSDQY